MSFGTRISLATLVTVVTHLSTAALILVTQYAKKIADDFGADCPEPAQTLVDGGVLLAGYWYVYLPTIFAASVLFVTLPLLRTSRRSTRPA